MRVAFWAADVPAREEMRTATCRRLGIRNIEPRWRENGSDTAQRSYRGNLATELDTERISRPDVSGFPDSGDVMAFGAIPRQKVV
jgi:hypothetical protein